MDYSKMSDFEINKRVAEYEFSPVTKIYKANDTDESVTVLGKRAYSNFDPCNNPTNAWPLIEQVWEKLMSVTNYDYGVGVGESKTTIWDARMHMYGDNKLRAACIVYLMMQEA